MMPRDSIRQSGRSRPTSSSPRSTISSPAATPRFPRSTPGHGALRWMGWWTVPCAFHSRTSAAPFPATRDGDAGVCRAPAERVLVARPVAGRAALGAGAGQHRPVDRHRARRSPRAVGRGGAEARYVEFVGLDQVERRVAGSVSAARSSWPRHLSDEVILASELNGAPLPPAHGFPLRAVVPGWIGARSVKWLGRISLLEEPSPNYFQSQAYRDQREIDPENRARSPRARR